MATIAKVFKNQVLNCKVFHPNGRQITFIGGKHITQIPGDIEYLEKLIAEGDQYVYVDPNEAEVDTEELTAEGRMAKIKREAIEEFLAAQAAAANHRSESNAVGASALNPGTSAQLINAAPSNEGATSEGSGVKVSAPKK